MRPPLNGMLEYGLYVDEVGRAAEFYERRIDWERGGKSLYFRDPDQHCVEVATRGTWETY